MILKIKQILELKSTKALIFKIIEHIWDGRLKKKSLRLPGLRNRKKWKKKKEDSILKDTIKYPNICINTVLDKKIETKWNKDYLNK